MTGGIEIMLAPGLAVAFVFALGVTVVVLLSLAVAVLDPIVTRIQELSLWESVVLTAALLLVGFLLTGGLR